MIIKLHFCPICGWETYKGNTKDCEKCGGKLSISYK